MDRFFCDHALLPGGWARHVALNVKDGVIHDVSAGAAAGERIRLGGVVLPGLPNLHSHTFQRGMAGLAERRGASEDDFWTWREVMYRFLATLGPEDVEAIAAYCFMDMLEAGFTAVGEFHYLHHQTDGSTYDNPAEHAERIAAAARATGIGLTLLPVFYAHGGFGGLASDPGQRRFITDLEGFSALLEASKQAIQALPDGRLGVAPHSLRAVTPEELRSVAAMLPDSPVHIHAAEQVREVRDCETWSGQRPVRWLLDNAGLDERWCLVHATHMEADEVDGLARSGAVAGLCPITEANLGDGTFAGADYLAAGGQFGVGSDSNIHVSAPDELRQLEYSQRLAHRSRNVLGAVTRSTGRRIYEAALSGGAQALSRAVGALDAGGRADFVVLDAELPELAAVAGDTWLDAYVFAAGRRAVRDVYVHGRQVVSNGRHLARSEILARYLRTLRRVLET